MEAPRFDVFLSHRSADKPAVEELARLLVRKGIEPWLDKWHLIPGTPWQEAIEKALSECASVAVCIGPGGTGPWQDEEMRAAINRRVQDRKGGFRVIPVLLPGAKQEEIGPLPTFLTATTWVEFLDTLDDEEAFRRLVSGILGVPPGPGPEGIVQGATPYRGLQYFDVGDSLFFAGRKKLTEDLLDKLRSGNRLLAVLGASGSGKSSLVRAGLLASLKQGRIAGSETWPQAILKPGEKPLERLVDALVKAVPLADDPIELIKKLPEDPRRLHYIVHRALRDAPAETRLVLFVDQFEEVFTGLDEAQSKALVENLLQASKAEEGRTLVLLTLRTDFFGHCSPDLAEALSNHHVLVGPMTEDGLRSAIERPAALVGCELEPGLTDLLLEEIEGQAGSLPLLQHALLEIWNRRQGRWLTVQAYREIKGVRGALEQHAEKIYGDFTAAEQEVCRRVLLHLVQLSEKTVATRRRLALDELGGEEIGTVVRRLTDARLLTTNGVENPTVELAHEALITEWERFKEWIENDRQALLVRHRLDEAITDWIANGRDASYLYQGGRLAQAEEWAARRPDEVNKSKREFLNASVAYRDEERRREIARARRLRLLSYCLAVGLILAVIAAGFAFFQWKRSEQRKRILLAYNLSQKVQSVFPSEPPLGLLLATEAVRLSKRLGESGVEQETALRWALSQSSGRALESGRVRGVGTTPDRRFVVTSGLDGTARIWDLAAKDPATSGRFLTQLGEGAASALSLTSDRRWLLTRVTEGARARIFLRDLSSKEGPHELPEEDWLDSGQPFSPDGRWLITHQAGKALLRDLKSGAIHSLGTQDFQAAAYSPDGHWLAMGSKDGSVEFLDLHSADPMIRGHRLPGSGKRIVSLRFESDSSKIEARYENRSMRIWQVGSKGPSWVAVDFISDGVPLNSKEIDSLRIPPEARRLSWGQGSIRFGSSSPAGRWKVTQSAHEPPHLWDNSYGISDEPSSFRHAICQEALELSSNGRFLLLNRGHRISLLDRTAAMATQEIKITGVDLPFRWALSSNGRWVAAASLHSDLLLWQRTAGGFRAIPQPESPAVSVFAFSPDSRWLAIGAAMQSSGVSLWNLREPRASPKELTRHRRGVISLAFDLKGRSLGTGGVEGVVRRYDLSGSEPRIEGILEPEPASEESLGNMVSALALSPDAGWLAVADAAGRIFLWKEGTAEHTLGNRSDTLRKLAFSPDGHLLAGLSITGELQLWRLEEERNTTIEPILLPETKTIFPIMPAPVLALAFSSGGQLITVSKDCNVLRWETDLDNLLKLACRTVGRNLTREEWETHLPGEPYNPLEPCPNLPPGE